MTSLFKSPKQAAAQPVVVPAPVVMPTENSAGIADAQAKEMQAAAARSGRASTFMSAQNNSIDKTDTMGGN